MDGQVLTWHTCILLLIWRRLPEGLHNGSIFECLLHVSVSKGSFRVARCVVCATFTTHIVRSFSSKPSPSGLFASRDVVLCCILLHRIAIQGGSRWRDPAMRRVTKFVIAVFWAPSRGPLPNLVAKPVFLFRQVASATAGDRKHPFPCPTYRSIRGRASSRKTTRGSRGCRPVPAAEQTHELGPRNVGRACQE